MRHLLNSRKRRKKRQLKKIERKTTIEQLKEHSILSTLMQLRIWSESVVDGKHSSLEEARTSSELVRIPQLKRKSRSTHLVCQMP